MALLILCAWALAAGPDPATIVGPPAGAAVAGDELGRRTYAVGKLLRCPVCQGLSVSDSPSDSARAMKDEVQALVAQGYDEEQVLTYFEASYGEFIRLEPKAEGWNLLVWTLPAGLLLSGIGLIFWRTRGAKVGAQAPDIYPGMIPDDMDPALIPHLSKVRADVGDPR